MVKQTADLSLIFGALADPTRRGILERLAAGEQRVTDLAKPFKMTLAAVSKHLRVLENAGLLSRRRDGRVHLLKAKPEAVAAARQWIEQYAQGWDDSFDALDRHLAKASKARTSKSKQ